MLQVSAIGLDIAKHVFHVHGADGKGRAVFSKTDQPRKALGFLRSSAELMWQSPTAHAAWPSGSADPSAYVKPFVKRQKNDAIDAEAICEAAQRPSMRFVAAKSEGATGCGSGVSNPGPVGAAANSAHERDPRTPHGIWWIAPKGPSHLATLADLIEGEAMASSLPEAARVMLALLAS
ncbi:hypothetical protein [Bradyrhizobium sp. USDA 4486]